MADSQNDQMREGFYCTRGTRDTSRSPAVSASGTSRNRPPDDVVVDRAVGSALRPVLGAFR